MHTAEVSLDYIWLVCVRTSDHIHNLAPTAASHFELWGERPRLPGSNKGMESLGSLKRRVLNCSQRYALLHVFSLV